MDGCRRSKTRTSSHTSESTGEFSRQDSPVAESMSAEWTDEKHSLYLKSMETSFVNQLYNSLDLLGSSSQKEMLHLKLSQEEDCNARAPSGQFKVLRHGCWQKVNFQRPESQPRVANEPCGLLASPWIQHFRSSRKHQVVPSPTPYECSASKSQTINLGGWKATSSGTATSSKHSRLGHSYSCHHDMVDSRKEVSDQNFVDEVIEGAKTSSTSSSKRMKTVMADASINDQVVPHSKPPVT